MRIDSFCYLTFRYCLLIIFFIAYASVQRDRIVTRLRQNKGYVQLVQLVTIRNNSTTSTDTYRRSSNNTNNNNNKTTSTTLLSSVKNSLRFNNDSITKSQTTKQSVETDNNENDKKEEDEDDDDDDFDKNYIKYKKGEHVKEIYSELNDNKVEINKGDEKKKANKSITETGESKHKAKNDTRQKLDNKGENEIEQDNNNDNDSDNNKKMSSINGSSSHQKVDFTQHDYRAFVFILHEEYGLLLLHCTKKKHKGNYWQLPGGHVDPADFITAGKDSNDYTTQLTLATKIGAARELFEETGIDVRHELDRLNPAGLRATPKVNKHQYPVLVNEHKHRFFYFLMVDDTAFFLDGTKGDDPINLKLKLSSEHSGFRFEAEPEKAAKLLEKHSGGKVSEALLMSMGSSSSPSKVEEQQDQEQTQEQEINNNSNDSNSPTTTKVTNENTAVITTGTEKGTNNDNGTASLTNTIDTTVNEDNTTNNDEDDNDNNTRKLLIESRSIRVAEPAIEIDSLLVPPPRQKKKSFFCCFAC